MDLVVLLPKIWKCSFLAERWGKQNKTAENYLLLKKEKKIF